MFKKLFSKEDILFEDMCETKEVQGTAIYLDMNEHLHDVSRLEKELDTMSKKYRKEDGLYPMDISIKMEEISKEIEKGHNRVFVGRVGNFCPIKPGRGGAELVKEMKDKDGNVKYDSVTGAKGYRWLESEMVRTLGKENDIDRSYYDKLVDAAVETISQFGDFEYFASDDPYIGPPLLDGSPLYHPSDFPPDDPGMMPWYDDETLDEMFRKR